MINNVSANMNDDTWYTDTVDIYRVEKDKFNSLTQNTRKLIASDIPCLIYKSIDSPLGMSQTAADVEQTNKLMCANNVKIRAGDELIIYRGGALGYRDEVLRAFAADPNHYYEPFGEVIPGIAHQEVVLKLQERRQRGDELNNQHT